MTLTPAKIDRLLVVGTAATLTALCGCLVHLWSYAADSSGEGSLMTAAALLLGVRPALAMPSRVVRAARRVFGGRPPGPGKGTWPDPRALKWLLAASTLFAGFCGLAAMPAVLLAKLLADWLAEAFVWTRASWLAAGMALRLVCLLPMAAGLAVTMLVGAMVRRGGGRDVYASVFRDWLMGGAAGLAILAAAWRAGVNLLGLALAMPVLLLAGGAAVFLRRGLTVRPPQLAALPEANGKRRPPIAIWVTFAAVAAGVAVQDRLAADAMGFSAAPRLAWAAASLGLLAVFLRGEDRRPAPEAARQTGGAASSDSPRRVWGPLVGLAAVFLAQCSTAVLSLAGGGLGTVASLLAALMQVPVCALAAGALSRQRRRYAAGGGGARSYLGGVCGGAGAGLLACLVAGWLPGGVVAMVSVGLGVAAWGTCREIFLSPRRGEQAKWAAVSWALLVSVTASMLLAAKEAGRVVGTVRPGPWLSSAAGPAGGGDRLSATGLLPPPQPPRSDAVTAALAEILSRPKALGGWWIVASSWADLPAPMPRGVEAVFAAPDPSTGEAPASPPLAGRLEGAFLQAARAGRDRYDGVFLAPMPADRPEAWRCYNTLALRQAAARVHAGGRILLRTQAREKEGSRAALAVAHSFLQAVGSGWVAAAVRDGWVDMLLIGPAEATPPARRDGLLVVPLDLLLAPPLDVPQIGLLSPEAFRNHRLAGNVRLLQRLEAIGGGGGQAPRP